MTSKMASPKARAKNSLKFIFEQIFMAKPKDEYLVVIKHHLTLADARITPYLIRQNNQGTELIPA